MGGDAAGPHIVRRAGRRRDTAPRRAPRPLVSGAPDYLGWEAYLESLAAFGMRPGLERVSELLARLGRPQDAYRVIHIVGTNGKSSTTRYCEALLRAHAVRSGAYLSPHISGWTERVVIDGRPIAEPPFAAAVERVRAEVAGLPAELGETTQFEVLTVAALLAFAESGVEVVALEAGLGGRLDATNVVKAPVVVLTNIALEHTEVLGDTRELIFAEKAAVIKGGDAVFGELDGLEDEARRVCAAAGASPHFLRGSARPGRPRRERRTRRLHRAVRTGGRPGGALGRPACADAGPVPGHERGAGGRRRAPAPRRPRRGRRPPGAGRHGRARPSAGGRGAAARAGRRRPQPGRRTRARAKSRGRPRPAPGRRRPRDHARQGLPGHARRLPAAAGPRRLHAGERAPQPHGPTNSPPPSGVAAASGAASPAPAGVEALADPHAALTRARELAGPGGSVLVGGSLYLLEDLRDVLAGAS